MAIAYLGREITQSEPLRPNASDDLSAAESDEDDVRIPVTIASMEVEVWTLHFPSAFGYDACSRAGCLPVVTMEKELRKGQANDLLQSIREGIGRKSFLIREAFTKKNKKDKNRLRRLRRQATDILLDLRRMYSLCRDAILVLGPTEQEKDLYKMLSIQDMKSSHAISDPNIRGERNTGMPWIWTAEFVQHDSSAGMKECKLKCIYPSVQ